MLFHSSLCHLAVDFEEALQIYQILTQNNYRMKDLIGKKKRDSEVSSNLVSDVPGHSFGLTIIFFLLFFRSCFFSMQIFIT